MENYTKLRVIGKGSYGEVWLVKHKRDRKQYVLKKINLSNASERERHLAEQEAKLLSKLKHPNIVSYKDSFETLDGILYIAMGFCEGGDLYSRLKERKGELLEERQIVEWFVQIAMALQYLHERNILHRDLKTQNIFVTKSKIIKVGDLGIARVLDHASDMANTLIGTPYYMSPELFSNKRYNHKSDVWALGCCVYEMATLKHAFSAKDMNALVYKILRGKMPGMPKQYSEELITLIKSMLNHNPDRRPSVNKILRDSYIRRNITLFLESSKKEKRPVRSHRDRAEREKSSEIKSRKDVTDGSNGQAQHQKLEAPCQVIATKDDDIESSKSDSGTLKIKEEISVKDESQNSDKQDLPHPLPVPSSKNHDNNKPRVFKPHQSTEDVLVAVDTNSSAKSSSSVRDMSPQQKHRGSRATRNSVEKLNNSSESSRSQSLENRPASAGVRRNSKDSDKPPLKSKSPEGRRGSKSVLDNAKIVSKPRPLPYRDPVTPRESNEEPKCSKSSRGAGNGNSKSEYSSGSKYSQDVESSRPNVSARERRRERKDRETPREPVSARSVDLINQRRSLDPGPQLTKPASSKSADYARIRLAKEIKPIMEEETDEAKSVSSRPLIKNPEQQSHRRQPSLDNDSSGTGSGDEDLSDPGQQKENKRKAKPLHSVANLLENNSCQERKISNSGNSDCLHPGRGPVKAFQPYSNPSAHENDLGGEENNGRERDMDNLISALNTTLLMNKRKLSDEDEDDEDDDTYPDDIVPEPPGGTKFIHRLPKPSQQKDVDNDVAVLEVESVEGSPDKFNVSICSPKAGVRTMTTTGRLWARITELRKDCIRGLGVEKIKRAYDILDNFDAEELEPQLVQLLGKKDFDLFSGKIWQLKFCEEAAFGLI